MRNLLLAILAFFSVGICTAQSSDDKPLEPTAVGQVYLIDASAHELRPLLQEIGKESTRGKGLNAIVYYVEFSGTHSAFRVKSGAKTEFVFKVGSPESVSLYPCSAKKKREADYATERGTMHGINKQPILGLPAEVTQYGQSSYKLVPQSPLAPGEYLINTGAKMFTFGVD